MGYFVLEGFDFGVGILLPLLGRSETDRRVMVNTIGPVWDGNEGVAAGRRRSRLCGVPRVVRHLVQRLLPRLLLILLALIARGVAFEYRGKVDSVRWRAGWDAAIFWGSAVPAAAWGVALANIVHGVPIDRHKEYTGTH